MFPKTLITFILGSNPCKIKMKDQEGIEIEGNNCLLRVAVVGLSSSLTILLSQWD